MSSRHTTQHASDSRRAGCQQAARSAAHAAHYKCAHKQLLCWCLPLDMCKGIALFCFCADQEVHVLSRHAKVTSWAWQGLAVPTVLLEVRAALPALEGALHRCRACQGAA